MIIKETYKSPNIKIFKSKNTDNLLVGSITNVGTRSSDNNDIGISFGGGGSGPARSNEYSIWDDDE